MNPRVKEIERQRAEALEGLKCAIEDDFNAVQDAYWFSVKDCKHYVQCWACEVHHERILDAMVDNDLASILLITRAMRDEVEKLVARYAEEEGQRAINRDYDNLLEDLANG